MDKGNDRLKNRRNNNATTNQGTIDSVTSKQPVMQQHTNSTLLPGTPTLKPITPTLLPITPTNSDQCETSNTNLNIESITSIGHTSIQKSNSSQLDKLSESKTAKEGFITVENKRKLPHRDESIIGIACFVVITVHCQSNAELETLSMCGFKLASQSTFFLFKRG